MFYAPAEYIKLKAFNHIQNNSLWSCPFCKSIWETKERNKQKNTFKQMVHAWKGLKQHIDVSHMYSLRIKWMGKASSCILRRYIFDCECLVIRIICEFYRKKMEWLLVLNGLYHRDEIQLLTPFAIVHLVIVYRKYGFDRARKN